MEEIWEPHTARMLTTGGFFLKFYSSTAVAEHIEIVVTLAATTERQKKVWETLR